MLTITISAFFIIIIYIFRRITACTASKFWLTAFIGSWGFILSMSSTNPEEMHSIKLDVYGLFIAFIVFYSIGFSINRKKIILDKKGFAIRRQIGLKFITNKYITSIFFLILLALIYYNYIYYKNISLLSDVSGARESRYMIGDIFKSGIELFIFENLISIPVIFIKFFLVYLLLSRVKDRFVIFTASLIIILWGSFGAGRNIIIEVLIVGILTNKLIKIHENQKNERSILFIISSLVLLLILATLATAFRSFQTSDLNPETLQSSIRILINHFIIYTTGSIRAFQYALENDSAYLFPSYGLLTFSGLHEIISYPLIAVGFDIVPYTWKYGQILKTPISIGPNTEFNALYSALYNIYFDFGLAGTIIIPLVFGYLCNLSLLKFLKKPNIFYFANTTLLFLSSIWTILTWSLASPKSIFALIILYLAGYVFEKKYSDQRYNSTY